MYSTYYLFFLELYMIRTDHRETLENNAIGPSYSLQQEVFPRHVEIGACDDDNCVYPYMFLL